MNKDFCLKETHNTGFSLTEMLVVCVLVSLLLLGLGRFFISHHHTTLWQQGIAHLQENGRFASFILLRSIENAGYQGCPALHDYLRWLDHTDTTPFNAVKGYNAVGDHWLPRLPDDLPKTVVTGSDIIEINYADKLDFDSGEPR